jgi:protein-S-isoprenylcysteine O-methyltransferase Ste14
MKTPKILPPTYMLLAIIAMVIFDLILPFMRIIPLPWTLVGIIPMIGGVGINLAADSAFIHADTTVKPFEHSAVLITDGLYRFSRNPMYLGFVLILLGLAMFLGSLTPFIIVILFTILVDRKFIVVEEGMLAEKFGNV